MARLVLGVAPGRRGCWRGRRGTWSHPSSFQVAGMVLGDIDFYSGVARVALMALGWLWWRAWVGVEQGDAAAVGVAGVALGDIHLRFTWHAWYLVTSSGHVPLLHHLHFCVHCDMFALGEIVVPASSVAI